MAECLKTDLEWYTPALNTIYAGSTWSGLYAAYKVKDIDIISKTVWFQILVDGSIVDEKMVNVNDVIVYPTNKDKREGILITEIFTGIEVQFIKIKHACWTMQDVDVYFTKKPPVGLANGAQAVAEGYVERSISKTKADSREVRIEDNSGNLVTKITTNINGEFSLTFTNDTTKNYYFVFPNYIDLYGTKELVLVNAPTLLPTHYLEYTLENVPDILISIFQTETKLAEKILEFLNAPIGNWKITDIVLLNKEKKIRVYLRETEIKQMQGDIEFLAKIVGLALAGLISMLIFFKALVFLSPIGAATVAVIVFTLILVALKYGVSFVLIALNKFLGVVSPSTTNKDVTDSADKFREGALKQCDDKYKKAFDECKGDAACEKKACIDYITCIGNIDTGALYHLGALFEKYSGIKEKTFENIDKHSNEIKTIIDDFTAGKIDCLTASKKAKDSGDSWYSSSSTYIEKVAPPNEAYKPPWEEEPSECLLPIYKWCLLNKKTAKTLAIVGGVVIGGYVLYKIVKK